MSLDAVLLSRIQFAFVIGFHIVFPAFTIGLAAWLVSPPSRRAGRTNSRRAKC
ncbi:MAG TPA: cytochrome ubiquinol oxidase subunit I [Burkholderiaceae bacterium]|nr:cytochrome ubiquinol oxidase subunit I [Burkholderiaceae bacterium]